MTTQPSSRAIAAATEWYKSIDEVLVNNVFAKPSHRQALEEGIVKLATIIDKHFPAPDISPEELDDPDLRCSVWSVDAAGVSHPCTLPSTVSWVRIIEGHKDNHKFD